MSSVQPASRSGILPQDLPTPDEHRGVSSSSSVPVENARPSAEAAQADLHHVMWGPFEKIGASDSSSGSRPEYHAERLTPRHPQEKDDGCDDLNAFQVFLMPSSSSSSNRSRDGCLQTQVTTIVGGAASSHQPNLRTSAAANAVADERPNMGGQWSIGAKDHGVKECMPCGWAWKPGGCIHGADCLFCHLCEQGSIQKRRKERARAAKERKRIETAEGTYRSL
eukprot:TRINITY_DN46668_c0_g1_i1.p1 TRINITY_DN46668_c0_g1~~TRINITY_DN46668_c0_g1_i1.p1  ORF type:complete len:223 (+),score=13.29 TRINITY_DN46668_c0_g1_i1:81-749(+)